LDGKLKDLKVQAGALKQQAKDSKQKAATHRFYASNQRDHLAKEKKIGGPSSVKLLKEGVSENIAIAKAAEPAAADYEEQAEDVAFAAEYHRVASVNSVYAFSNDAEKWLELLL
jgi:hypothetical protein